MGEIIFLREAIGRARQHDHPRIDHGVSAPCRNNHSLISGGCVACSVSTEGCMLFSATSDECLRCDNGKTKTKLGRCSACSEEIPNCALCSAESRLCLFCSLRYTISNETAADECRSSSRDRPQSTSPSQSFQSCQSQE